MLKFLENLKPLNTFITFTHCDKVDESEMNEEYIKDKLKSIKKYTKLTIPFENVVLFDKTKASLDKFVEDFV